MPGVRTPSKFLKFKPHHARRKPEGQGVPGTPMMDMMTIVLVFLLKTFSTQGDLSSTAAHLSLPKSDSKAIPGVVDRVAVGSNALYFLHEEILTTDEGEPRVHEHHPRCDPGYRQVGVKAERGV